MQTFKTIDKDNNEIECTILFTFKNNDKNYIIYTDGDTNTDDFDILASRYQSVNGNIVLTSVESDDEWNIIDQAISDYIK